MNIKWSVHPALSMLILYFIVTQQLYAYSVLILSLVLHEAGHILMAILLKVKIRKLILLPFGGQLMLMPASNIRMLMIISAGPVATLIGCIVALYMQWELFKMMQLAILLFNSLPIWPLDGGKMIFYSMQLISPSIPYARFIELSLILAVTFAIASFIMELPIFFQISLLFLCIEAYQAFRARKYVHALQLASRFPKNDHSN